MLTAMLFCTQTHHTHKHTQDGCTALYLAELNGHEDVVDLLLEANAYPDLNYDRKGAVS